MNEINNTESYKEKIRKLYLKILKRSPDEEGLNHYLNLLESKEIDEIKLEAILKSSDEAVGYVKNPKIASNEKWNIDIKKPFIVAMYRIKNEERWIKKSLDAASEICQEIVVLDDGSTDNTLKICKECPNVVDIHHQENLPLDETRDRNVLLQMALKRKPEFIFTIDGDEILNVHSKYNIYEELVLRYPSYSSFSLQFLTIVDKPNQYLAFSPFNNEWDTRLIRINENGKKLFWPESKYPGNIHPNGIQGRIPIPVRSKMKVLHYGYYDNKLRKRKYDYYNKIDPNNLEVGQYKWMISLNSKKIRTLNKGEYVNV